MAGYLREVFDAVQGDDRLVFYTTFREPEASEGDHSISEDRLPCKRISVRRANILPWDLVVMADHPGAFTHLANPNSHQVLRIPHGIGSKQSDGVDYQYQNKCFDKYGSPVYTRIFESSEERKQQAVSSYPILDDIIKVVGNIRADRITARRKNKSSENQYKSHRKRILIAGSWGENNLFDAMDSYGIQKFLEQFGNQVDVSLRPHPNLLTEKQGWHTKLKKLSSTRVNVSEKFVPIESDLTNADLLIADDLTSVGLFAAATQLPTILFRTNNKQVGKGTYLSMLSESVPSSDSIGDLPELATKAIASKTMPRDIQLVRMINSYPDEGESRVRKEIYDLLNIPPPPETADN